MYWKHLAKIEKKKDILKGWDIYFFGWILKGELIWMLLRVFGNIFFSFFWWKKILLIRETNYKQRVGSSLTHTHTKRKVGGQLPQSKESKKLQVKDHLAKEGAIILASLGIQEIETLESKSPLGNSFQKLLFKKLWKLWFEKCCWTTCF